MEPVVDVGSACADLVAKVVAAPHGRYSSCLPALIPATTTDLNIRLITMNSVHLGCLLLGLIFINSSSAHTIEKRHPEPEPEHVAELDPINEALNAHEEVHHVIDLEDPPKNDREKRLALIKSIGAKALLLNFVFGKIDGFLDHKIRVLNQLEKQNIYKNEKYFGITTPKPIYGVFGRPTSRPSSNTTTPAPILFSTSSPVSLVIPDRLYGNSFGLVTNISQTIGDVLFNTAERAQEFSDRVSAKLRRTFRFTTNLVGIRSPKSKS